MVKNSLWKFRMQNPRSIVSSFIVCSVAVPHISKTDCWNHKSHNRTGDSTGELASLFWISWFLDFLPSRFSDWLFLLNSGLISWLFCFKDCPQLFSSVGPLFKSFLGLICIFLSSRTYTHLFVLTVASLCLHGLFLFKNIIFPHIRLFPSVKEHIRLFPL